MRSPLTSEYPPAPRMTASDDPDRPARLARLARLEAAFAEARPKLERMVRCRLVPPLAKRVDVDDVLQDAWLDAVARIDNFALEESEGHVSDFVWMRRVVLQTLIDLQREHLDAEKRAAGREVNLRVGPVGDSAGMSALLAASLTSPSGAAMRAENNARLIAAIDAMDSTDREIVVLRHFEELSNEEAAAIVNLPPSTASYRYIRALASLKSVLDEDRP